MRSLTKEELEVICGGYDSNEVSSIVVTPGTGYTTYTTYIDTIDSGGDAAGGSGSAVAEAAELASAAAEIAKALSEIDWDALGVDANELFLKFFGGYNNETVDTNTMDTLGKTGDVTIYESDSGNLYADRDGDGVIDTGILYNSDTGIVSADWDANGTGDQVIADLKP